MNRRRFAIHLAAAAAAPGLPLAAQAQGAPVEGRDYARLVQPLPMPATGKIEVVEFFGYWCPHCNSFEPTLDAWSRKLPADVVFRRVPVAFSAPQEPYAKIYFSPRGDGPARADAPQGVRCHPRAAPAPREGQRDRRLHDGQRRRRRPSSATPTRASRWPASSSRLANWPTPTGSTACPHSASTAASSRRRRSPAEPSRRCGSPIS